MAGLCSLEDRALMPKTQDGFNLEAVEGVEGMS